MDSRLSAIGGCKHINSSDGAQTNQNFFAFVPDQDTVLTVLSGIDANGNTKNFLTTMGLSGKTLKAGSYYAVAVGEWITTVTSSSGAAVFYQSV